MQIFDLHRHNIDHITIPSSRGPEFGVLRRIEDVRLLILGTIMQCTYFCMPFSEILVDCMHSLKFLAICSWIYGSLFAGI